MDEIHVVAAIIFSSDKGRVLIAKRLTRQHQGGLWEFPGGKVEPGESAKEALMREVNEELGIIVDECGPLMEVSHCYSDKSVLLDVWTVQEYRGEPRGMEGQRICWAGIDDLHQFRFPQANKSIVERVRRLKPR